MAAGGFEWVPIGEDVHSGVKLGWAGSDTVPAPLPRQGRSAHRLPSLANQQARWCRSSMLLMVEKHFLEAPFTWQQRAAFWAAFLYYMSSAALLLTGPFPTLTMIWFYPEHISAQLPADPAGARGERLHFPAVQPRLATDDLAGMHNQLLRTVCRVVRDPGTCRRVGADWRLTRWGASSGNGKPDPLHLDYGSSSAPLVGPGAAGARVRMAYVLGDEGPKFRTTLHANATLDSQ